MQTRALSTLAMPENNNDNDRGGGPRVSRNALTARDIAKGIARQKSRRVLILSGNLDGHNGLPGCLVQHGHGLRLCMFTEYTSRVPTGLFEVTDEDALCAVIDELQCKGGYRASVINPNGERDPSYVL